MSNKDAHNQVLDMIKKRIKKSNQLKSRSCKDKTYKQEIIKFLEDLEIVYINASSEVEYSCQLDIACSKLLARLRTFDINVNATIKWNDPIDWKDLRAIGVTIL